MIAPPTLTSRAPAATDKRLNPRVAWWGAVSAGSSGIALAISILTRRPLWLAVSFIAVPGFIALTAMSVLIRGRQQELFLTRVRRGLVAGVAATAAYDVTRALVEIPGLASTNTFRAIPVFGTGLTGQPPTEPLALVAGWGFHIFNGLGFALAYTLVWAGRPWPWAVAYALGLEAAMIILYPSWLGMSLTAEFLSVSILGHVAFGAVLGVIARRTP
jgi:hypothetical protein